jgi:hypothetical protein
MAGKTNDPSTLMRLMRHTSLNTTTKYMRPLHDSMRDALKNLGRILGADLRQLRGIKRRETT